MPGEHHSVHQYFRYVSPFTTPSLLHPLSLYTTIVLVHFLLFGDRPGTLFVKPAYFISLESVSSSFLAVSFKSSQLNKLSFATAAFVVTAAVVRQEINLTNYFLLSPPPPLVVPVQHTLSHSDKPTHLPFPSLNFDFKKCLSNITDPRVFTVIWGKRKIRLFCNVFCGQRFTLLLQNVNIYTI